MPNKRKNRDRAFKFLCPCCQQRLWRLGSPKYYLFYQSASEIRQQLGITRKKANFIAARNSVYVDHNAWLEEFYCEDHGKMWMKVSKQADGVLVGTPAKGSDWNGTSHTINPDIPNPSVSEFSYRMSRGANKQLV